TIEGFDFHASPKLPAAAIRDLAALRWLHAGESVILYGPVGVGKSHIAQALGHLAVRHGAEVRFLKTSRALAHLAGGHADRTWDKRQGELTRPHVLIPTTPHRDAAGGSGRLLATTQVLYGVTRPLGAGVESPPPQALQHPQVTLAIHADAGRPRVGEFLAAGRSHGDNLRAGLPLAARTGAHSVPAGGRRSSNRCTKRWRTPPRSTPQS